MKYSLAACLVFSLGFILNEISFGNAFLSNTLNTCHPQFYEQQLHRCRYSPLSLSATAVSQTSQALTKDASRTFSIPSPLIGIIFDMDGTLIQHVIDFPYMRQRIYDIAIKDPLTHNNPHILQTCVLELRDQMSPQGQRLADVVFREIEDKALQDMELREGGLELALFLKKYGIRMGVLTRNVERSAFAMHEFYIDRMGRDTHQDHDNSENYPRNSEQYDERSNVQLQMASGKLFHPIVARDTIDDLNYYDYENSPTTTPMTKPMTIPPKPNPAGIHYICSQWNCHPSQVLMVGDSIADDIVAANKAQCGGAILLTQKGGVILDTNSGGDGNRNNSASGYDLNAKNRENGGNNNNGDDGGGSDDDQMNQPSLRLESLFDLKYILEMALNK